MLAPAEPTSRRPRWTAAVAVAFTAIAALAIAGVIALRADNDADTPTAEDGAVTTGETGSTAVAEVDWQYGSSLPGALRHVAAWPDGLAAIVDVDGDETAAGGEVWYSADGIEWEAALIRPPGQSDQFYSLVGADDQLFALTGDPDNAETPQTLWNRRVGEPWAEVITSEALDRMAVGPDRLIAYGEDGFNIVGVFDTATLAPVEVADLPEIDFGPASTDPATGEPFEPVVTDGYAVALDEGFLAHFRWITGVDDDGEAVWERTLMYSADGSVWMEHPDPPDGEVFLPYRETTPVFDGLNLLSLPNQTDTEPWITDDGLTFSAATDPGFNGPTGTDEGFFTVDTSHRIFRSTDGITWEELQAPPTWPNDAAPVAAGDGEVQHGSIYTHGDRLLAIGLRGDFEGWVGYINPTTEIWVSESSVGGA